MIFDQWSKQIGSDSAESRKPNLEDPILSHTRQAFLFHKIDPKSLNLNPKKHHKTISIMKPHLQEILRSKIGSNSHWNKPIFLAEIISKNFGSLTFQEDGSSPILKKRFYIISSCPKAKIWFQKINFSILTCPKKFQLTSKKFEKS